MKSIRVPEVQDALTRPASRIANAVTVYVVGPTKCASQSLVMLSDEEDWTTGNLGKVAERQRVGDRRRFRDLQESCRARSRKVPKVVSEADGLAIELVKNVAVESSSGVDAIFDPRINGMTGQLRSTRAEVVSLIVKSSDPEDARDKVVREHEYVVRTIWTETKTSKDQILAE